MALGNVRKLLLSQVLGALRPGARIALCCAGKYFDRLWPQLQPELALHRVVAILDDAREKLAAGAIGGVPVRCVEDANADGLDAVLITTDRLEDQMFHRLTPLAQRGVRVIRAGRVELNPAVTPQMVEALLSDPNLDLHERPAPWEQPLARTPDHLGVEITTGCNLNCLMCETHLSSRANGHMELELFQKSLDELDAVGCRLLTLHTIGEPTIHKQFTEFLRIAHLRGFEVFLSTNGQLLDRFIDALIRWPVAILRWSVDGATRETYEHIRAGGKFSKLMENLQRMHAAIQEHRLPTVMHMNVALSADNVEEVPLFYETYGRFIDDGRLTFGFINSLSAGDGSYYEETRLLRHDTRQVPCDLIWRSMFIGVDGKVSACCRDYHGELIVGDVREHSAEQIWRGEAMSALRRAHLSDDPKRLPRACQTCYRADTGHAELLAAMVAALRRVRPALSSPVFAGRIVEFTRRLSGLEPPPARDEVLSGAGEAGRVPLPILS